MTRIEPGPRAPWLWAAIVIPLGIVLAVCAHWEPVLRDGWGHLNWYRNGGTLDASAIYELVVGGWRYENPRLGQTVSTILYADGPLHVIATVALGLGLFTLLATMVLGRWPSVRRGDDALAYVTVVAIVAWCVPQFGPMLFYRPFLGNYTFGLVLQLAWLVPYRLQLAAPRAWRAWWTPLLFVLGAAAGMCNEHTGPAFLAAGLAVVVYSARRGDRVKPWMLVGLAGLAAGYVLLMIAPGHAARYDGLAQQAGAVERVLKRGIVENLKVVGVLGLHLVWALPWLALGLAARRRAAPLAAPTRAAIAGFAAMGLVITLVLLGSPKIGPRLYLHSVALVACALAAWVLAQLSTARLRLACGVVSAAIIGYVAVRCVVTYRSVGPVGEARLAAIRSAPAGTRLAVPRFTAGGDRYFLGEDLDEPELRARLATWYGLAAIDLTPP